MLICDVTRYSKITKFNTQYWLSPQFGIRKSQVKYEFGTTTKMVPLFMYLQSSFVGKMSILQEISIYSLSFIRLFASVAYKQNKNINSFIFVLFVQLLTSPLSHFYGIGVPRSLTLTNNNIKLLLCLAALKQNV